MSQISDIPDLRGQPPQSDIHPHPHSVNPNQPPRPAPDPNLDPKLSGDPPGQPPQSQSLQLNALDSTQILNLLRHLPNIVSKVNEHGGATAEQLQALAAGVRPMPGPSNFQFTTTPGPDLPGPPPGAAVQPSTGPPNGSGSTAITTKGTKRKRSGKPDDVEDEEDWTRQRKDNHKEVERRRRGNINEGINELARIVPNGSGEKAKGAILNRAVQYIHHLKENEARNIEKWTLEKLLMDQAMGDLQAQLDDMRRLWDEERQAKERALIELDVIRAGGRLPPMQSSSQPSTSNPNNAGVPGASGGNAPYDRAYHPSDRHHHVQGQGRPGEVKDAVAMEAVGTMRDPDMGPSPTGDVQDASMMEEESVSVSVSMQEGREGKKRRV